VVRLTIALEEARTELALTGEKNTRLAARVKELETALENAREQLRQGEREAGMLKAEVLQLKEQLKTVGLR
jgi:uncharacterized coiled-coil DUF342 family protein